MAKIILVMDVAKRPTLLPIWLEKYLLYRYVFHLNIMLPELSTTK